MSAMGDVLEYLVVPAIVVEVDEPPDRNLRFPRHIVRQLVHVPLQRLVVALQLPVGLRVVRRCEYVPDTDQLKVFPGQS